MPNKTETSLTVSTASGLAWTSIASALLKLAGLITQIVLGWLLSEGDFAVYAIAISISSIFTSLKNGGVQRLLVQRGDEYGTLASPLFKVGLIVNCLLLIAVLISAKPLAVLYATPELPALLLVIGLTTVVSTPTAVLLAKLSIDLRFRAMSTLHIASGIIRTVSTIGLAVLGFAVYSFVLPTLIIAFFETTVLLAYCGRWQKGSRLTRPFLVATLRNSSWLAIGSIGIALATQGDYLVIGYLETKSVLALYFFGFQLMGSVSAILTSNFAAVLMPTFVRLKRNEIRLRSAYLKSMRVMSFYSCPFFILLTLAADPAIRLLWGGKWDAAIIVTQLIGISSSIRIVTALPVYLLESQGKWRMWTFVLVTDAIGTTLAALVGALAGGLTSVTISVCLYRVIYGCWIGCVGCTLLNTSKMVFVSEVMIPFALSIVIGTVCLGIQNGLGGSTGAFLASSFVFFSLYVVVNYCFRYQYTIEAYVLVQTFIKGRVRNERPT